MTGEEQIEEILWEAHSYGIRNEVMDMARQLIENGTPKVEAYHKSFNTLTK
tara:strand:- start:496 stop:648 length:153 start_codon:yes stop_codon:yes gene_type:complete